ncbi:hypothetical protein R2Q81_11585 [Microbacterium aquimaris]|uniref:hypothetical protein n=1 Tax=Microbacterium aquimaris TaxID=459816 RepID=UPI002AD39DE8|nr:hypothetical protein [Microbacterium aquimaris]MDZ8276584.1 hypothetical protein [Microbacterium aquimaris]
MTSLTTAKRSIALALLATLVVVGVLVVGQVGAIIQLFTSGADTEDALHEVDAVPTLADELVTWEPDAWTRERELEPATRVELESAYVRAWAAMGVHQSTGDVDAVEDTFTGGARENVLAVPPETDTALWTTGHRLTLTFYSRDGSIAAFDDAGARVVREVSTDAGTTIFDTVEPYAAVMVLEDGYWRIDQLRREGQTASVVTTRTPEGAVSLVGLDVDSAAAAPGARAVTYPAALWTDPGTDIAGEIDDAVALGAERVRVALPEVTAETLDADPLARLEEVATATVDRGLQLDLVLLDQQSAIDPGSWPILDAVIRDALETVDGRARVVDLMDGVDGDDLSPVRAAVLAHVAGTVADSAPATPQTIGWVEDTTPLPALQDAMGELTVVAPAGATVFSAGGEAPSSVVLAPGSTVPGWSPVPHTAHAQAVSLAASVEALEAAGTPVAIGDLRDAGEEGGVGVRAADGTPKPAAALLATDADFEAVGTVSIADVTATRFWQVSAVAGVAVVAVWAVILERRHRRGRRGR